MAVLTELQRDDVWAQFMAWLSNNNVSVAVDKHDLRQAVTGIDEGVNANLNLVDAFLSADVASSLDNATKNYLFSMVVARRLQEGI